MMDASWHTPVLLNEVLAGLALAPGAVVVDGTLGDGGHSAALLAAVGSTGLVIGIDRDSEAIAVAKRRLSSAENFHPVHGNFRDLQTLCAQVTHRPIAAVLLDLGWSSTQFQTRGRGFSFMLNEPLDMRYDVTESVPPAAEIINTAPVAELERIFRVYGEERRAGKIASAIVTVRRQAPIVTTQQLANLVMQTVRRHGRLHPATQIFQALRIAVNDEFGALRDGLAAATEILAPRGRLAVITFHSGEDRLVKNFSRHHADMAIINKKVIIPGRKEVVQNPRSRSAKLRLLQKI